MGICGKRLRPSGRVFKGRTGFRASLFMVPLYSITEESKKEVVCSLQVEYIDVLVEFA